MSISITQTTIPAMHVVIYTGVVPTYFDEGQLWEQMMPLLQGQGITPTGPCGVIEHSQEYVEKDVKLSIFCPVANGTQVTAPLAYIEFPERDCVVARLIGPYSGIKGAHDDIATYMVRNNLGRPSKDELAAKTFNIYLTDPSKTLEEKLITDIHVPVYC